jgi:hypothetical protein
VNIAFFLCIPDALLAFMTKVMPLITSVNTVNICGINNGLDLLEKEEYSVQAKRMLESARVLWAWSVSLFIPNMASKFPKNDKIILYIIR